MRGAGEQVGEVLGSESGAREDGARAVAPSTGIGAGPAMLGAATAALGGAAVQRKLAQRVAQRKAASTAGDTSSDVQATAERGFQGPSQALPHGDAIQASFGRHDASAVQAHVGGAAAAASHEIGAVAYASDSRVAFAAQPDLHTAAHEAAHVVQQRAGVHLAGGVGQEGDRYEQHADAVADMVVQGKSAESLLDAHTGGAAPAQSGVQKMVQKRGEAGDATPAPAAETTAGAAGADPKAAGAAPRFGVKDQAVVDHGVATFGVLTAFQAAKIKPAVDHLAAADFTALRALLDGAGSDNERAFLFKALAANHPVADLAPFATAIAGHDLPWLLDHCTGGDSQMDGTGTAQTYKNSCGPTTVQTIQAEYDPIYALKLHTENANLNKVDGSDPKKFSPKAAEEQRSMLESTYHGSTEVAHKGSAVALSAPGGAGRWVNDWLDKLQDSTGMTFGTLKDPSGPEAVALLDRYVGAGMMTPIVIGNSKGDYAHYNLVMHEQKVARPAPAAPAAGGAPAATPAGGAASAPATAAAPAAPAKVHPYLRQGAQGSDVVEAQVKLKNKGFEADPDGGELQADGYFGPKMVKIVRAFQKAKAIGEDGVVGPITWGKLDDGGYTGNDGKTDPKTQREFQFHDVGGGTTMWIPEDDIAQGVINGPGYPMVTALELPSAAPPKKDKKPAGGGP